MANDSFAGVRCETCGEICQDYTELAHHISRKKHKRGRIWAARYLLTHPLSAKARRGKKVQNRAPLTDDDKVKRESSIRELSGDTEIVMTYCPKCKTACRQYVPVEFSQSPNAWRTGNGTLIMSCPACRLNENKR